MGVGTDPLTGHGPVDLTPLDAAAFGQGDLDQLAYRKVGDRVEARLAQDDLTLDVLQLAGLLGPMAVDQGGIAVEPLAIGRRQELEVEIGPRLGVRQFELGPDPTTHVDDLDAHAGERAGYPVTVAIELHRPQFLGFTERL